MSNFWTSQPGFTGEKRFKYSVIKGIAIALMLSALLLPLSGCGPLSAPGTSQPAQAPADYGDVPPIAPLLSPPGADERPLAPGQTGRARGPQGLPAMQPARGVSIDQLFAEDIRDPIQRIRRVENAVLEIRQDLDALMPAIVRLVAVESDIQHLIAQLESLLRPEPPMTAGYRDEPLSPDRSPVESPPAVRQATAPPAPAPTPPVTAAPLPGTERPQPITPQRQAQAPPPPTPAPEPTPPPVTPPATQPDPPPAPVPDGLAAVAGLRFGEHADRTRIVLDVTGQTPYRFDLDNEERLLIVELPEARWNGRESWSGPDAPLVTAYTVQSMDGGTGTRLILQLNRDSRVIEDMALPPAPGGRHNRIVIDLRK